MTIPAKQKLLLSYYILNQLIARKEKFPLVLMLEPLFRCNLKCRGCGKIQLAESCENDMLSAEECIGAAEECKAPVVSIAGGEPLLHPDIHEVVEELAARRRFIYLCTNALLMKRRIDDFRPSSFLAFNIHIDGLKERHDSLVSQEGVFDNAVASIRMLIERGFRVTTNTTLFMDETPESVARLFDFLTDLGVEGMTVAPAFNFEEAIDTDHFLNRSATQDLFRRVFKIGRDRHWKFNHSNRYLDFLAGERDYQCIPWGNPTRNVFGWQRPCYLLNEEYAETYQDLMENTDWSAYGPGKNPKCASCMVHCGFEPSAVMDTVKNPFRLLESNIGKWWHKPGR